MANFTSLTALVGDMFDLIDVLITRIVDLMTGNLLVLVFVGLFIGLITAIVIALVNFIRNKINGSIKMK